MHGLNYLLVVVGFLTSLLPFTKCAVLLVSFDGFRSQYLQDYESETSWFHALKRNGSATASGGIHGTFVTKTFPTHVTLSTGLYEESHGIVSNIMYDPTTDRTFSYKRKPDMSDPTWWSDAVPIWITAEEQGKKSGTFFWPGSEVPYGGVMQTHWVAYDKSVPFRKRVYTVVDWLSNGTEFATLYFNEPDSTGHRHGPNSKEIKKSLAECNKILEYLMKKLSDAKLLSTTDIIIVSDHGMAECKKSRVIPLYEVRSKKGILYKSILASKSALLEFIPENGKSEELYQFLNKLITGQKKKVMKLYRRSDIPNRFHYKNNPRIPEVLILANEGYVIATESSFLDYFAPETFGSHSYDNAYKSMEPIFIAQGPNIAKGTVLQSMNQVDIYNLLAKLLNIKPRPNNGSLANIEPILMNNSDTVKSSYFIIFLTNIFCLRFWRML